MKLQSKINKYHLIVAILVTALGITIITLSRKDLTRHQQNERLRYLKEKFLAQAQKGKLISWEGVVDVKEIPGNISIPEQFREKSLFESSSGESVPYLFLDFSIKQNGKNYKVTIYHPVIEKNPFVGRVTLGLMIIFSVFVMFLYGIPNRIIKKIWRPFYSSLDALRKYRIAQEEPIKLISTDIDEFKELNETLKTLTLRLREDYINLKEFTENASHEFQTPLAIIKSKIELYLQYESIDEEQLKLLKDINDAAARLSKLNQSLLLLTKIENRQFGEIEDIDLKTVIEKQLCEFRELTEMQEISIKCNLSNSIMIKNNPALADILVRNLLKNAIRYCEYPFKIMIETTGRELIFSNTGKPLNIKPGQLFERFKKNNTSSESLGLGLSIVKKICDISNYEIGYLYKENFHTFIVKF